MKMAACYLVLCFVFLNVLSTFSLANNVSGVPLTSPLPSFSAIFVFGDSLFDDGNNNNLLTLAKANFRPYGIDSPWGPTGRFSNGKLIIDLLGELLNHPYLPAYEDTTDPKSILRGVNYASAGSGILEETGILFGQRITFSQQVQNFQKTLSQLKDQMDDKNLSQYLAKSLAIVNHGSNDYIINYLLYFKWVTYDPQSFADLLIQSYKRYIMDLHGVGLKKFLLAGAGPLGCIPKLLSIHMIWPGSGQCVEYVNDMVGLFNAGLISLVKQLNNDNPGSIFVYGNTFDAVWGIIQDGYSYGFRVVDRGCCGILGVGECLPFSRPCMNRDEYVFWDPYHPTEAVYRVLALKVFNGSSSDCFPVNVSTMATMY